VPALNDLIGGHIQVLFSDAPPALPLINSGKVRALGVTTGKRMAAVPEIAPIGEPRSTAMPPGCEIAINLSWTPMR
jgi:tripartite-type tricarboxylate transporter receptor subunit TctC